MRNRYEIHDAEDRLRLVVRERGGLGRWFLRQALESVSYNGWMTIESNGDIPFEERNRRLDLILAGR